MAGHKLTAETICRTITGKKISLADAGPPEPTLARTRQLLKDGGYYIAELDLNANRPARFEFHPLKW